jgi:acetolactate synthase-1/3 small subunit
LIKVAGDHPEQVQSVAEMYGGQAVDVGQETITVELTGSRQKIEAAIETFQRFEIVELTRTGTAALTRGDRQTAPADEH